MGMATIWLFTSRNSRMPQSRLAKWVKTWRENAKGVAKGITLLGYAGGLGMGAWGTADMYKDA